MGNALVRPCLTCNSPLTRQRTRRHSFALDGGVMSIENSWWENFWAYLQLRWDMVLSDAVAHVSFGSVS